MNVFVGFILVLALGTLLEGYFVIGRAQKLMGYAEQLFTAAAMLLALAPGKSAPPTVAPAEVQPRRWWQMFGGDPARAQLVDEQLVVAHLGIDPADIVDEPARFARIRAHIARIRSHVDEDLADEPDTADDTVAADQLDRWADDGGAPAAERRPLHTDTTPDLRRAAAQQPPAPGTPPLDRTGLGQRTPTAVMPVLDDVELVLARFRQRATTSSSSSSPHRHRYEGDD